jgi:hypothetical protein
MAEKYGEMNELFNEGKNKHIGFLVNYKWF